jgi:hypothetical protein
VVDIVDKHDELLGRKHDDALHNVQQRRI